MFYLVSLSLSLSLQLAENVEIPPDDEVFSTGTFDMTWPKMNSYALTHRLLINSRTLVGLPAFPLP